MNKKVLYFQMKSKNPNPELIKTNSSEKLNCECKLHAQ